MASPRRFVILAAPRTGSNLLCTLLGAHPDILCHHELFNPNGIFAALDLRRADDFGSTEERDRDPLAFLERVWAHTADRRCVGFKMTRGQCPLIIDHVLRDPAIQTVVLRRRNRLKTYVSTRIAEETGVWEAYSPDDIPPQRPLIHVDLESLEAHAASNATFYVELLQTLDQTGKDCLQVTYEELLTTTEQRRLLDYLGVPRRLLEPVSVKQNPRDLRRLVADYSDLREQLRGTPYFEELHELGD